MKQLIAPEVNQRTMCKNVLLTGKREQALNSSEIALQQSKALAKKNGQPEPEEKDLNVALVMGDGVVRGCKDLFACRTIISHQRCLMKEDSCLQ